MKPLRCPEVNAEAAQLRPLGDFVLVRPLPEKEKEGRIFLPENARNPERGLRRGVVVACGPGDKVPMDGSHLPAMQRRELFGYIGRDSEWYVRLPIHVQPGDEVIFPRVPANVVNIGGEELVLIHEEQHVLAVLEKE